MPVPDHAMTFVAELSRRLRRLVHGDEDGQRWKPVLVDLDPEPDLEFELEGAGRPDGDLGGSQGCDVPLDGATHLYATARSRGRPVGSTLLEVGTDPFPGTALRAALVERLGAELYAEQLRHDLQPARAAGAPPSAAVVVCTRDRPDDLARCLAALARLDPPVPRVLVVDNGSQGDETRRTVVEAGVQYVHEPLPGLDRARNRGIAEADADVVLFTDDDVEVDPGWASALLGAFEDPLVMVAVGLVLPARLDALAQRQFERWAGFGRGYRREVVDGSRVPSWRAGSIGAGASMAVRSSFAESLGGFAEELDAGMPTRSGGDTSLFYRTLREGYRIVYEPSAIAHHHHRANAAALEAVLRGYGTGMFAHLIRALLGGDVGTALRGGTGSAKWSAGLLLGTLKARPGALPLRIAVASIRGAFEAPASYVAARRTTRGRASVLAVPRQAGPGAGLAGQTGPGDLGLGLGVGRGPGPTPSSEALPGRGLGRPPQNDDLPTLSVVIPSRGRRQQLLVLLGALDTQRYPDDRLEVLVVLDGDVDGSAAAVASAGLRRPVRVLVPQGPGGSGSPTGAAGPGAARNRGAEQATGEILVFLDDDVVPAHDGVLNAHAQHHSRPDSGSSNPEGASWAVAVGPYPPPLGPVRGKWPQHVRNWGVEQHGRYTRPERLGFADLLTGNLSMPRALFDDLGGFEPLARREDWELGWRLVRSGIPIRSVPGAHAVHGPGVGLLRSLENMWQEGAADVEIARRHPGAFAHLPPAGWELQGPQTRAVTARVQRTGRLAYTAARLVGRVLPLLERLGLQATYLLAVRRLQGVAYWAGVGEAAGGLPGWLELLEEVREGASPPCRLDLARPSPPEPGTAPEFLVEYDGEPLGRAPVLWGGVPWDATMFVDAVIDHFAEPAYVRHRRAAQQGRAPGLAGGAVGDRTAGLATRTGTSGSHAVDRGA